MSQSLLAGTGVVGGSDLQVTTGGGLNVAVASGSIWVPGTQGSTAIIRTNPNNLNAQTNFLPAGTVNWTDQGSYFGYLPGSNLQAISGTGSSGRVDLVCAIVNDSGYSGLTSNDGIRIVVISGSSSPPSPSSMPANCVVLAELSIPANTTTSITSAMISDQRPFMLIGGGGGTGPNLVSLGLDQTANLGEHKRTNGSNPTNLDHNLSIPTDGLYAILVRCNVLPGQTGNNFYSITLQNQNNATLAQAQDWNATTLAKTLSLIDYIQCSAGDQITVAMNPFSSSVVGNTTFFNGAPSSNGANAFRAFQIL